MEENKMKKKTLPSSIAVSDCL